MSQSLAGLLIQVDHATQQAARACFGGNPTDHKRWRDRCQPLNSTIAAFLRDEGAGR